jgi:hypothetical protein
MNLLLTYQVMIYLNEATTIQGGATRLQVLDYRTIL